MGRVQQSADHIVLYVYTVNYHYITLKEIKEAFSWTP